MKKLTAEQKAFYWYAEEDLIRHHEESAWEDLAALEECEGTCMDAEFYELMKQYKKLKKRRNKMSKNHALEINKAYDFDAGYDRIGTIKTSVDKCCVCKKVEKCLAIDNSEEEYLPGKICKRCIDKLFSQNI